jgi:hypothetical protein
MLHAYSVHSTWPCCDSFRCQDSLVAAYCSWKTIRWHSYSCGIDWQSGRFFAPCQILLSPRPTATDTFPRPSFFKPFFRKILSNIPLTERFQKNRSLSWRYSRWRQDITLWRHGHWRHDPAVVALTWQGAPWILAPSMTPWILAPYTQ